MSRVVALVLAGFGLLVAATVIFPTVKPVDVLGSLGFFSIAVGFAFRDILENLLAGLLLLFRAPFRVGDEVDVEGTRGSVVEINLRETVLRTYDGRQVLIPNSTVYKNPIVVQTGFGAIRSEALVGVAYDTDLSTARAVALEAVQGLPSVLAQPAPLVLVGELGPSTVQLQVLFWTEPQQALVRRAQDEVLSALLAAAAGRRGGDAVGHRGPAGHAEPARGAAGRPGRRGRRTPVTAVRATSPPQAGPCRLLDTSLSGESAGGGHASGPSYTSGTPSSSVSSRSRSAVAAYRRLRARRMTVAASTAASSAPDEDRDLDVLVALGAGPEGELADEQADTVKPMPASTDRPSTSIQATSASRSARVKRVSSHVAPTIPMRLADEQAQHDAERDRVGQAVAEPGRTRRR